MYCFKKTAALCLLLAAALLNSAFTGITETETPAQDSPDATQSAAQSEQEEPRFSEDDLAFMKKLNGRWQGNFRVVTNVVMEDEYHTTREYYNDAVTMDFVYDEENPKLFLQVETCSANYLLPREWHLEGDSLVFTFNDKPWQAVVTLRLGADQMLTGTYRQKEQNMAMTMRRVLAKPVDFTGKAQFTFEDEGDDVWYERLRGAPSYSGQGAKINYSYELGVNSKNSKINSMYNVTKLTQGKTDIQKMIALLNLVSDNFKHDGASGMPEQTDAISCINYAKQVGGIECRGLSSILAEMCRMAGIPAKAVMCIPSKDPCDDCHVVVHAYSQSLGQWVMLDPTYRLILRDSKGRYLDLPTLREKLISGEKIVPNDNAGRNGAPFYMEYYRAYMAKNMFRFSSLTDFGFDAAGKSGNQENMLLPLGYTIPFLNYRTERLTTCAAEFWAAPTGLPAAPAAASSAPQQEGAQDTPTPANT